MVRACVSISSSSVYVTNELSLVELYTALAVAHGGAHRLLRHSRQDVEAQGPGSRDCCQESIARM